MFIGRGSGAGGVIVVDDGTEGRGVVTGRTGCKGPSCIGNFDSGGKESYFLVEM